ncbi:MAG: EcsC family protein [Chitinophagaceae bacterium]
MSTYEEEISQELKRWQKQMVSKPSGMNKLAAKIQTRLNRWIPEKVHKAITTTIKQMVRAVLFGAKLTTKEVQTDKNLEIREAIIQERINFYKKTAAAEGGITGAGGILLGLADFPILMGIKLKLLFEIAVIYGYSVKDYKERIYILYIFQLAFSSHEKRKEVYLRMLNWEKDYINLPEDINEFDWRTFQQEYRDYIDLAKMAQLIPIIGAPVGAVVNYGLIKKLGKTAMNAYRMREPAIEKRILLRE